ncbi:MAG: crossover junction endodeoxyribonuclease RuvC [Acidobacteriota bacterium]
MTAAAKTPSRPGRRPLRVLGLDPGSRHTGYGLVLREGSRMRALRHGRLSLGDGPLPARLAILADGLRALIEAEQPDVAVLESLFRGVNARSLIVLAQARGVLLATLALAEIEIHEYAPAEVKTAVTGSGRADKRQVERMVRLILGLGDVELSADASDALGVAICFGQRLRVDGLSRAAGVTKRPSRLP